MTELFCKLADHFDVTLRALACRQDGRKTETALEVDVLVADGWDYVGLGDFLQGLMQTFGYKIEFGYKKVDGKC